MARTAIVRWPAITSLGIGVPGLYDPVPDRRGSWSTARAPGRTGRSTAPVQAAPGVPVVLINDARAFGLAELRLGAGRAATRSMVGLTLGTGVGGVIADRWARPSGPRRHGRRDRASDDRPRRAAVRLRQPRLPGSVRPRRPDRGRLRHRDRGGGSRRGTSRRRAGTGRAGPGRALPRHRDRQHDHGRSRRIVSSSAAGSRLRRICCSRRSAKSSADAST